MPDCSLESRPDGAVRRGTNPSISQQSTATERSNFWGNSNLGDSVGIPFMRATILTLFIACVLRTLALAQTGVQDKSPSVDGVWPSATIREGLAHNDFPSAPAIEGTPPAQPWNWHMQSTFILQGYPSIFAKYSGPNSLPTRGQWKETQSMDIYSGFRLWSGAELHVDVLTWQGYGFHGTLGIDDFPNGEAYKVGTYPPHAALSRFFILQTVGLGGERENLPDEQLTLTGRQHVRRLTLTIGRFSAKDVFDNNAYANDPRTPVHELGTHGKRCLGLFRGQFGLYDGSGRGIESTKMVSALRFFPNTEGEKWVHGGEPISHLAGHRLRGRWSSLACLGNGIGKRAPLQHQC